MVISKRDRARFPPGRSWRTHHDTDIGVCRQDLVPVAELLEDWDVRVTYDGVAAVKWSRLAAAGDNPLMRFLD